MKTASNVPAKDELSSAANEHQNDESKRMARGAARFRRLPMQQGSLMRTASIVGVIMLALGIGSLAYFASPVRLMVQDVIPHKTNLVFPILGALALGGGIVLLFATRPRG